jgi:hypothetical protein
MSNTVRLLKLQSLKWDIRVNSYIVTVEMLSVSWVLRWFRRRLSEGRKTRSQYSKGEPKQRNLSRIGW